MAEKILTRPKRSDRCERNPLKKQYPSEYQAWVQLRQRCYNPKNRSYPNYGGRGIKVSVRWDTFEVFMLDMGPRPSPAHSIERSDNNRHYGEPGNCYWGTSAEQNNNTRRNRPITYQGRTLNLQQWADEAGITHAALLKRIRAGWSIGQALGFEPPPFNPKAHNGTSEPRVLETGVNLTTYKMRLASGWSEEDARKNIDGRSHKKNRHPKYIYVRHSALGEGEFTLQQAALIVGKKPNTVAVAISRYGKTPLQALGLEEE